MNSSENCPLVTVETIINSHKEFSSLLEKDYEDQKNRLSEDPYDLSLNINSPEFLRQT